MMRPLSSHLRRFIGCARGNYAMIAALVLPMLVSLSGGAVDFYVYNDQQKQLQNVADSAALAAAREASLGGWSENKAKAVVDNFVAANLPGAGSGSAVYKTAIDVDRTNRRVSVTIDQDHYGYFVAGYFKHSPQIRVNAVAQTSGSTNVCVIGLNESDGETISLNEQADLFAPDCAVYSNSSDSDGMTSRKNALLTADLACTAGGYKGAPKNFSELPLTDCPVVADPLASRAPPAIGPCLLSPLTNVLEILPIVPLLPGTYCGGVQIKGGRKVILVGGIYIFKDGPFIVDDNATVNALAGAGVGLYFTGKNAYFEFKKKAKVDLKAMSGGPAAQSMAGLLIFQDRNAKIADFKIESDYTRNLIGTIYLPRGNLIVNANNDVARESAYTAIVVRKLELRAGPNLVLNTNYDETTVPVPSGLGPTGGESRLVH